MKGQKTLELRVWMLNMNVIIKAVRTKAKNKQQAMQVWVQRQETSPAASFRMPSIAKKSLHEESSAPLRRF